MVRVRGWKEAQVQKLETGRKVKTPPLKTTRDAAPRSHSLLHPPDAGFRNGNHRVPVQPTLAIRAASRPRLSCDSQEHIVGRAAHVGIVWLAIRVHAAAIPEQVPVLISSHRSSILEADGINALGRERE